MQDSEILCDAKQEYARGGKNIHNFRESMRVLFDC